MKRILGFIILLLVCLSAVAQQDSTKLPKIVTSNGRHVLMVNGKPFFILGGQAHNSSAWPAVLPQVWNAINILHANTLEVPIYWENIETQQNMYNFALIDTLLLQARQHDKKLIFLWFATWKNGSSHYMPQWMKKETVKYPNIVDKTGHLFDSPSPNSDVTLKADVSAFKAVMSHLKSADKEHTVIMVQVENEPGAWGTVRDFSPSAQKLFNGQVPAPLLRPEVLKVLKHSSALSGTWNQIFGENADEYFQAWSVASFIGKVASAGKAVYPIPMYVNAALRDPLTDPKPPSYESGGPTDNVIAIWKAAAPAIDLVAPDIYLEGSTRISKVIELYNRPDNALLVPEAALEPEKAKYLYQVLAHGGVGFSPFGIDVNNAEVSDVELKARLKPFSQDYKALAGIGSPLAEWVFNNQIIAVTEQDDHAGQTIDMGLWQAKVAFGSISRNVITANKIPTGRLMLVNLQPNKFIAIGSLCNITFKPIKANENKAWQYLKVEEGYFEKGIFIPTRILNGDETDWGGPRFDNRTTVLQIELILR